MLRLFDVDFQEVIWEEIIVNKGQMDRLIGFMFSRGDGRKNLFGSKVF